tara:strand:+ start:12 stop:245 length:234 start_codon:yes stop_codon:yes gene_type:complete
MNIDTSITVGSNEVYISLTPFEFSYDKSWGMTFNIMKLHLALTEEAIEKTFAVFSYTNTVNLRQLEILGIKLIIKFK